MFPYLNTQLIVAILTAVAGIIPLVVEFLNKSDFSTAAIATLILGIIQIVVAMLTKQQARARGVK